MKAENIGWLRTSILAGAVLLLFVGARPVAAQAGTLDQECLWVGWTMDTFPTANFQQGARADVAGQMVGFQIYLFPDNGPTLRVSVHAGGPPWQVGTPDFAATLTNIGSAGWYYVDLSGANIRLEAGQEFTIGLQDVSGQRFKFGIAADNQYPQGMLYSDGIPFSSSDKDMAFRTYMQTGEPHVDTLSFTAEAHGGAVTLTWETGVEIDSGGFNLYRAASPYGPLVQVNEQVIDLQPLLGGRASYTVLDKPGPGTTYYWLEKVESDGARSLHGPVGVRGGKDVPRRGLGRQR
jgi:hypothetical protein